MAFIAVNKDDRELMFNLPPKENQIFMNFGKNKSQ
jgi:hypothetical protein